MSAQNIISGSRAIKYDNPQQIRSSFYFTAPNSNGIHEVIDVLSPRINLAQKRNNDILKMPIKSQKEILEEREIEKAKNLLQKLDYEKKPEIANSLLKNSLQEKKVQEPQKSIIKPESIDLNSIQTTTTTTTTTKIQKESCIALYPFEKGRKDELSFKSGDIINIIEKEGKWWKGELNGVIGKFPYNYVKIQEKVCIDCSKSIDFNSNYCNFCGKKN
jgi:hypothetical protein